MMRRLRRKELGERTRVNSASPGVTVTYPYSKLGAPARAWNCLGRPHLLDLVLPVAAPAVVGLVTAKLCDLAI